MLLVWLIMALIIFDLLAWRWGVDTTDPFDHLESERHGSWRGWNQGN
jgi:hypothetical protein